MSTKINVRSPFYLNLTEPVKPLPLFTCDVANIQQLNIDQQGQISNPNVSYGVVLSITSTDSDFANDKFATVTTATARVITVRVSIPEGFSNTEDGFLDCSKNVTQPALITSQPTPSDPPVSCSGGPTATGSISAQTLDVDGDSETIDLSSFFTAGSESIAGYTIYNPRKDLVNASVSGDDLTISSNRIGGSTTIYASAYDNGSNTCTASQGVSVTVNAPSVAFACSAANFSGGTITQSGTITKPNSIATVGTIKDTSGGSAITSYPANNTGSARDVTLFFDLTAPQGYSNAGSTVECSHTISQPAGLPEFTCELANLTGQNISNSGQVDVGITQLGSIDSYTPLSFPEVSTETSRSVTFTINIPSGYSNSGTIDCVKTLTQPSAAPICGSYTYYLTSPMSVPQNACTDIWDATTIVKSTADNRNTAQGDTVCLNNAPFDGKRFYYGVTESVQGIGKGTGNFFLWRIDENGIIMEVYIGDCPRNETQGNIAFF